MVIFNKRLFLNKLSTNNEKINIISGNTKKQVLSDMG